ncbi:MAG: DUF3179 domain-containing protein [Chloroflexi bacterium]|nr:DUF3179 domain-containing protein [Chloroflexota bacterium]
MFRGLVISGMFAFGIAVGCSQQDGTTSIAVPNTHTPTVGQTPASSAPVPSPTRVIGRAAATDSDATVAPASPPARAVQAPRRRGGFVPLDDPVFLAADATEYFGDEELVLGVEFAGEVRAYPVRMLRYHHIVNDTVGGKPLLVTY